MSDADGSSPDPAAATSVGGPSISVCVVTFNRLDQLRTAVDRLLAEPIDHLVVVDNGSTDGTRQYLAAHGDPRLELIESARNLGGAGGFELAMRYTMDRHAPDWLLLQDDDASPVPGSISRFRELDIEPDVGGVAAAVYTPAGDICEVNRPGLNPFTKSSGILKAVFGGRKALHVDDGAYRSEPSDVDTVSFVGYFVRGDLIANGLGYPRGEFFIYSDDQLYSTEVRRLGWRNLFVPEIEYCHDTASKSDAGYFSPVWKVYFLYRNNIEFYRAMAGRWFPMVMVLKLPAWVLRVRHYPNRRCYLRMLRIGVADGVRRRFDRDLAEVQSLCESPVDR